MEMKQDEDSVSESLYQRAQDTSVDTCMGQGSSEHGLGQLSFQQGC